MRILQIGKFYHPNRGGVETVVRTLSEGLVKQHSHHVTVLCTAGGIHSDETVINGVTVMRTGAYGRILSQTISPLFAYRIGALASEYDLIHLHTPHPLAEASLALLRNRRPIIVTYHSDVVRQRRLGQFYSPFLRRFLRSVDRIVVAAQENIDFSPVLSGLREKCGVIPFGLEPANFQLTEAVAQRVASIRKLRGPFLLFAGRLVEYKGVEYLIRGLSRAPAIKAVIIGDGPLRKKLEKLAQASGLADRVDFVGEIQNDEEMLAYFHACEAFVLPSVSRNEAFGMVLLEAMACGKALISSRLDSGVRFVNEDQVTGFQVGPRDDDDLARAMVRLMTNENLRKTMGEAAKARFDRMFAAERMVDSYHTVYTDVLAGKVGIS